MTSAEGGEIPQSPALAEAEPASLAEMIERFSKDPENNRGDLAGIVAALRAQRERFLSAQAEGRAKPGASPKAKKAPASAQVMLNSPDELGF